MFEIKNINDTAIAVINKDMRVNSSQDFLDIMVQVYYDKARCMGIAISEESILDDFFDLKKGIAGDVLQKFSNYSIKVSIYGDFTQFSSKSLTDFMRECNRGNLVSFVNDTDEAIKKLS